MGPSDFFYKTDNLFKLYRLLLSYALQDEEIGYVQGMNFIMAALLLDSSEIEAFYVF